MCVDSVDREWPFTSLPRKSCPFARTHGPFSREHYPLLGTYFPLLLLSSLGRKKKTAMAQWKQALFWFFLYALKSLNTGLGNCLNIRIIDVKDSLKFTLHKFYNPPSTTLHSCFFCSFLIVLHCFIIILRKYYPAQQKLYNWNNVTVSICLQFLFLSRLISVKDLSANEAISISGRFF